MNKLTKRTTLLLSLGMLALPLTAAATAYACTSVATLSPSTGAVTPGSTVTVSGAYYGVHNPADATTAGPVEIRLASLSGPVLATATPSGPNESFSVQVTIPQSAAPGGTFLTATQENADGTPVYGTPARQVFTVMAPAVSPAPFFALPIVCVVPSVTGKRLAAAERLLGTAHCALGNVTKSKSKSKSHRGKRLVVASTGLSAGAIAAGGTKVNLRLHWA